MSEDEVTVLNIIELKELLDELDSQADNYGQNTEIGRLLVRAEVALYGLARSCLDAPR